MSTAPSPRYDRRSFMGYFASIGLGSTLLPGVLWARAANGEEITPESIASAEEIAGVQFDEDERKQMVRALQRQEQQIEQLHAITLPNSVPPAIIFDPVPPGTTLDLPKTPSHGARAPVRPPAVSANLEDLAFLPVTALSELVRTRKVTSVQLTRMYLERLRRYDPTLHFVVNYTEERAMKQARAADEEIARGKYRGPLHGIPWGAKDLFAVAGTPTTWGAAPYKDQMIDSDATIVQRLDAAGAVLVAKLTLGALAMGDQWFGGQTRNPWKPEQGSSGSSAGPGSATAAGCVGFAVGTETLGSISSPSTRNGVTGLRPTFGRVPRTGAMALSWTMDKIGPMCRAVEDCAFVLEAMHGADGMDLSAKDIPFVWDARTPLKSIRVGYAKADFERDYPTKAFDQATLDKLRSLGVNLLPVDVPDQPYNAMRLILNAEAAAAFDDLTRSGRDKEMTQQGDNAWPNTFRTARFIPAADYVNANRARVQAMRAWAELMKTVDIFVAPTFSSQLTATNLTGHPALILPNGFRDDGTPVSITFVGGLYKELPLLVVGRAYQEATDFHLKHPTL
ncbi:MAG TPA: amidase [Gemmatimonadaceae bacterium]|nr:amidase [Gemmatimonadaceae bacterium]